MATAPPAVKPVRKKRGQQYAKPYPGELERELGSASRDLIADCAYPSCIAVGRTCGNVLAKCVLSQRPRPVGDCACVRVRRRSFRVRGGTCCPKPRSVDDFHHQDVAGLAGNLQAGCALRPCRSENMRAWSQSQPREGLGHRVHGLDARCRDRNHEAGVAPALADQVNRRGHRRRRSPSPAPRLARTEWLPACTSAWAGSSCRCDSSRYRRHSPGAEGLVMHPAPRT